ncbi:MAG: TauD/TfdA family dioxygenase, partial [bacterium]|nr:TauD/TfdA family dioxygenase [bacterium]
LEADHSWRQELPEAVTEEFLEFVAKHPAIDTATFEWRAGDLPELAGLGRALRTLLLDDVGLCRVRGIATLDLTAEQRRLFYLAIGSAIGSPMLQYGRLYPVVDRGKDYTTQAVPVSMTNAETCFHTDSSSIDALPDVIGLYCEQPSREGGDSLVSNALAVYDRLQREQPDVLAVLSRPWIRDVVTPGLEKTAAALLRNRFPVFARCDTTGAIRFRYMRYWIEKGQERAGQPLGPEEVAAFDRLDELLAAPQNVVRFRLERGDVMLVNNRTLAHNRTAYVDDPDNPRLLQRMWLDAAG